MTSWTDRAKTRFSETGCTPTDITDETPASVPQMPMECPDKTDETLISSVLAVEVRGIYKNSGLLNKLLPLADLACDHHGDGEAARAEMRADCLATPPHLRADLLRHLERTYSAWTAAEEGVQ